MKSFGVSGSFARNFAVTFSGNTMAVLGGLIFTPFISRVYSPEGYGAFAVYMAMAQNAALISTLQLPRAFVLPADDIEYKSLLQTSLKLLVGSVLLIGVVLVVFDEQIIDYLQLRHLGKFFYIFPFTVFLYALNDILRSHHVRQKSFQRNASSSIISSISSRCIALAYGVWVATKGAGLILGDSLAKMLENIFLVSGKPAVGLSRPNTVLKRSVKVLVAYKSYPMFILPGLWLITLASQMPLFFSARWFSPAVAGNFSFATSLLNMPVAVLAGAISPVFLQKASEIYNTNQLEMPRIVRGLSNRLFFSGVLPILTLTVFGDWIFVVVLGSQWRLAGELAGFLGLHYLFFIVANPLMTLYRIYRKERFMLGMTMLLIVINTITLSFGYYLKDIHSAILLYSLGNVLFSMLNMAYVFRLVSVSLRDTILKYVLVAGGLFGVLKLLRIFFS